MLHIVINYLHHLKQKRRVTVVDITLFLRQLATLITSGISIVQSCDLLEKSQEKTALRLLIHAIKRDILSGKSLFHSFQNQSNYFDELTRQLINIGEHTGQLDVLLLTIAHHQEKNLALKKRIKQALFYPGLILFTACAVTFSMLIFVIPRFAELFQDHYDTLPLLTRSIFYLSTQLKQHSPYFFAMLFCLCLFIFLKNRCPKKPTPSLQKFLFALPFIKKFNQKIILARFARNLAITLSAGLPLIEALTLTAQTCGHIEFIRLVARLRRKISAGVALHRAMETLPFFPSLMTQMIKTGEESGQLEAMLEKVADFFESDLDQLAIHLSQLLEPLIMIVLGVLIGGLVIGMYLPIFKLGSAL